MTKILSFGIGDDSIAQLVEQYTFNVWALGSSPSRITKRKRKLLTFNRLRFFISIGVHCGVQFSKNDCDFYTVVAHTSIYDPLTIY
jgi:hypothetical protein